MPIVVVLVAAIAVVVVATLFGSHRRPMSR
jgi:hypothetical protein